MAHIHIIFSFLCAKYDITIYVRQHPCVKKQYAQTKCIYVKIQDSKYTLSEYANIQNI